NHWTKMGKKLLQGLRYHGRNVSGSSYERDYHRQIGQALLTALGPESFMCTVNFDDQNHPLVLQLAGSTPDKMERLQISNADAVAVSDSAWELTTTMFRELFAFDLASGKSLKDQGILGHLEHVLYQYHDQNRGGLHVHFLGWITGFPDPQTLLKRLKEDNEFQ
ncbi:hypothetical protein BC829DRAFT_357799, partial [Chytridium lagenaria]